MKILLAWSSGKDSAWTLHVLRQQGAPVAGAADHDQRSRGARGHARRPARCWRSRRNRPDLPLWQVPLPWPCSNDEYEARMADACRRAVAEGFDTIAFGDLYLADVRAYRERQLAGTGLAPIFPLVAAAHRPTGARHDRGRLAGAALLHRYAHARTLPSPAGNSTPRCYAICRRRSTPAAKTASSTLSRYDGPMFRAPIAIETGEPHTAGDFLYTDLLCPASSH